MREAAVRFAQPRKRRTRADQGKSRLSPAIEAALRRRLRGDERPEIDTLREGLARLAARRGERAPSRATIYNAIERCPPHRYVISELPEHVRRALYNLDKQGTVPGPLLAQYALQHGGMRALSFAAGLPWLDLHQASRLRGWRPQSVCLLRAILRRRGIG